MTQLDRYDAGLLGNGGGGDIGWWQDYVRAELDRAHEFYQGQAEQVDGLPNLQTVRDVNPRSATISNVIQEIVGARTKFPRNKDQFIACGEEVGEVANAILEHSRDNDTPQHVYTECIQAAAMFIRLAEEGTAEYPYRYNPALPMNFRPTGAPKLKDTPVVELK